jgi:hypothetical protein
MRENEIRRKKKCLTDDKVIVLYTTGTCTRVRKRMLKCIGNKTVVQG